MMSKNIAALEASSRSLLVSLENEERGINGKPTQQLLREVEEAFESMDRSKKRDYEIAVETVPHLVSSETPLLSFLRTDNYDPSKSATRLALYWKYRRQFFGERWLLPMTQTGRGTLTRPEILMLRTGFMHPYPVGQQDFLCVLDYSRLPEFMEHASIHSWNVPLILDRVCLYLATVGTNQWACQAKGMTYLHVVNSKKRPLVPFREEAWKVLYSAYPLKVRRTVVAEAYEKDKQELLQFIRFQTSAIVKHNSRLSPIEVYSDSVQQTLDQLLHHGLPADMIPDSLGGDFCSDAKLAEWMQARLVLEEFSYGTPTVFDVAPKQNALAVDVGRCRNGTAQFIEHKRGDDHSKKDAVDPRRVSRKKPETSLQQTSRQLVPILPKPAPSPNSQVSILPQPTQFPNSQYSGGQTVLNLNSTPPQITRQTAPDQRRPRKPDTYSRRNDEILRLAQQRKELNSKNDRLRQQNRRLEDYLARARLAAAMEASSSSVPNNPLLDDSHGLDQHLKDVEHYR